jgi:hypothetical protein
MEITLISFEVSQNTALHLFFTLSNRRQSIRQMTVTSFQKKKKKHIIQTNLMQTKT